MFYGSTFTYGGVSSATYGLVLADFNYSDVEETSAFSPNVIIDKPAGRHRFIFGKKSYEEAPSFEMEVVSQEEISVANRAAIHRWLIAPSGMYSGSYVYQGWGVLTINDSVISSYSYHATFTEVDDVYFGGRLVGFRLHGVLDAPFAYGVDSSANASGTGSVATVTIANNSDIGYVYPTVTIRAGGSASSKVTIEYTNVTDTSNRTTIISQISGGSTYTIDGENRYITSTVATEGYGNFNKIWPRLVPGTNTLNIKAPSGTSVTTLCPTYKMIGM